MITAILSVLRFAWPYLLAASVGASAAWSVQGFRLDSAKAETKKVEQRFEDYKQEQRRLALEAADAAEKRRENTIRAYSAKLEALKNDHEIYKRCVAAGKCGAVRVPFLPANSPGLTLPPASGANATGAQPVFAAGVDAAEALADCALTTLMLNQLQADIEAQTP